ncbi:MAG TPA: alpha/beta hydrolase [Beijerinckiaceae bacterium]|nr:alpha/beta hydrolase [Beijerinckiaceae bacterium]
MRDALNRLYSIDANPAPPGAEVVRLTTTDGLALRAAVFRPANPRASVVILQGRSEYIERYFETIGELMQRGFAVVAFDWRGQGGSMRELSDPMKGHVDDFLLYLRDLDAVLTFIGASDLPRPCFGLAHSMGGAVLALALNHGEQRLARAVVTAPMLGIYHAPTGGWGHIAARLLNVVGLGGQYVPVTSPQTATAFAPFEDNVLTSDPERHERSVAILTAAPELAVGAPTISWVAAAFRLIGDFNNPEFGLRFACPLLLVLAGGDRVVDTPAAERFALRARGASTVTLTGAQHEILMERDVFRAEFWAAFDAFVPHCQPGEEPGLSAETSDASPVSG